MGLKRSGVVLCAMVLILASGCGDDAAPTEASVVETDSEPAVVERSETTSSDASKEAAEVPDNTSNAGDQFGSLGEAANFAEEVTGQPAPIPHDLHLKGDAKVYIGPDGDVQLTVSDGDQPIVIRYGNAIGFDGCELPPMKTIEVGKEKGLLGAYDVPGKKYVYEAIWPATPEQPVGTLAISGLLSEDEILKRAEAIQKVAKAKVESAGSDAC